jgi:hypothetical protein
LFAWAVENLLADRTEQTEERKLDLMFSNPELYGAVFEDRKRMVEQAALDEFVRRQRAPVGQRQEREKTIQQLLDERQDDGTGLKATDDSITAHAHNKDWVEAMRLAGKRVNVTEE